MDRSQSNNTSQSGITIPPPLCNFVLEQVENLTRSTGGMTLTTSFLAPPGVMTINTTIPPRPSVPLLNSAPMLRSIPVIAPPTSAIRMTPISGGFQQPQYTPYNYGGPYPYFPYSPMGPPYLPTTTPYGYSTPPGPYVLGAPGVYYDSIPQPSFPPMSDMRLVMLRSPSGPQLALTTAIGTRPIMSQAIARGPNIQPRNLALDLARAQAANTRDTNDLRKSQEDHEGHKLDQLNAGKPPGEHPEEGQGESQAAAKHKELTGPGGGDNRQDYHADQTSMHQYTWERLSRQDKINNRHERRERSRIHRKGRKREKDSPSPRREISLAHVEELIQTRLTEIGHQKIDTTT